MNQLKLNIVHRKVSYDDIRLHYRSGPNHAALVWPSSLQLSFMTVYTVNWADPCWPTKMCQCKRSIIHCLHSTVLSADMTDDFSLAGQLLFCYMYILYIGIAKFSRNGRLLKFVKKFHDFEIFDTSVHVEQHGATYFCE